MAARAVALSKVGAKRNDVEGLSEVDLEAQSAPEWKNWVKTFALQQQLPNATPSCFSTTTSGGGGS